MISKLHIENQASLKASNKTRYEFIKGQDHDWWVYDNLRGLYRALLLYGASEEKARKEFFHDLELGIPEDNWVDCEDV